jgi:pyrroline-5-carboxylate reductase
MADLGFVGTGTITAAIVEGLSFGEVSAPSILVSPRNVSVAERLTSTYRHVETAVDNQHVLDRSQLTVFAVRPQVAQEVIRSLRFREDQKIVALMAGISAETLRSWIGPHVEIVQVIPLPFVAARKGVTVVCPPDQDVQALFGRLGTTIPTDDPRSLKLFFTASALMGTYFGILETVDSWLKQEGLKGSESETYLNRLFAGLSHAADSGLAFSELRKKFSTKGGINEQFFRIFSEHGGRDALQEGLVSVLQRLNKA